MLIKQYIYKPCAQRCFYLAFFVKYYIIWSSAIRAENMEVCGLTKLLRKLHVLPPPHRRGFYICW